MSETGLADDGMGINEVEKALERVNVAIRDSEGQFRGFTEVLDDLYPIWSDLDSIQRSNIATALAGVRQKENLLVLLENEELYRKGIAEQMGAEGLAMQRYEVYLDSLEAAQNRQTASLEALYSATIEGDLVKWYYDASAGLFDFITQLGGLDALIPGIISGIITYTGVTKAATIGTFSWATAMETLAAASTTVLPLLAALAVAMAATEVVEYTKNVKELNQTLEDNFAQTLRDVANETKNTDAVIKQFSDSVEYLNSLSWWESFGIDEQELINKGFTETLDIIKETSSGWQEYSDRTKEAAAVLGYMVDGEGRLYKERSDGYRMYAEALDTMSYSEWTAGAAAEQLNEQIARTQKLTSETTSQILNFTESFQGFLSASYEAKDGAIDEAFGNLYTQLSNINGQFQQGTIDTATYFEQLQTSLDGVDMNQMFGEDQDSAELFFAGITQNAAEAMSMITEDFVSGETSLTQYTEQLYELGDVFEEIYSIAETFGLAGLMEETLGGITEGIGELRQAQEANIVVQETLRQITEDGLQFESEAYAKQIDLAAQAMAASGQIYRNNQGQILQGSEQLRNYMMADAGNFQHLADQTANATGESIKKVVVAAGKMLQTLGNAISSFDATIAFEPHVTSGVPIAEGIWGNVLPDLPAFQYDVSASSSGLQGIGEAISSFGSSLESNAANISLDASIYTQGFDTAADEFDNIGDTVGSLTNAFNNLSDTSGKTAEEIAKDAHSIDDLLDMVVKKIKQEQKARKDALKDQLADYRDIIDARKKLLKTMQEEEDYQRKLRSNQQELGNIQSEIEELRLDDSEEAAARRRALEEEAAQLQEEIDQDAADRSIEIQENALDADYENFKDYIDSQIEAIDDYLSKPGQIVSDALSQIEEKGSSLYQELIDWNAEYGSGIVNDVVSAWEDAYAALKEYGGLLSNITGNNLVSPNLSATASFGGTGSPESMSGRAPMMESIGIGGTSIENLMNIEVAGGLDSSVVPEIENIANMVVDKLNNVLRIRGGVRNANQFSI